MKKLLVATLGVIATATLTLKELPVTRAADVSETEISSSALKQLTPVSGTSVLLIPPENFVPADRFPGYQQEATNSSIVVTEIPGPVSELADGLTNSSELDKKGLLLLEQEEVTVAQQRALLLKLQQTAYGTVFGKWVLLLGNETESMIVTATFPQELAQEYSEILKRSLLTLQLDSDRPMQTDDLLFRLSEYGDLKLAQRVSNALLYSKNGNFPATSVDEPFLIVAPSFSPQFAEPEAFACERLLATEDITEINIEEMKEIIIDDLDGYEIVAQGRDRESDEEITIYQVILFDENSYYYLLQGQISNRLTQQYLPIFKRMARSFERQ